MQLDKDIFVEIKTAGKEIILPADWLSFSITDSIHSIYNTFDASILDRSGAISEVLMTAPGNIFNLTYGKESDIEKAVSGNFIINSEKMATTDEASKAYGGKVDILGFHEWFNIQSESSASFKGTPSDVVKNLTSNYSWKKKNITSTQNSKSWFQGLRTPAKFIQEILVSDSYSGSHSPFFSFINSHNEFNFVDYHTMFNGSATDLYYEPTADATSGPEDKISSISRWDETLQKAKSTKKIMSYFINKSGEVVKTELDSNNFFKKSSNDIYLVSNQEGRGAVNHLTRFYNNYSSGSNVSASDINSMRDSMFRERFVILLPLKTELVSGKTINLYIYLPTEANDSYSNRFSGKYLIESSTHVWSGETKSAMTRLIISKKYNSSIPDDFQLKRLFK